MVKNDRIFLNKCKSLLMWIGEAAKHCKKSMFEHRVGNFPPDLQRPKKRGGPGGRRGTHGDLEKRRSWRFWARAINKKTKNTGWRIYDEALKHSKKQRLSTAWDISRTIYKDQKSWGVQGGGEVVRETAAVNGAWEIPRTIYKNPKKYKVADLYGRLSDTVKNQCLSTAWEIPRAIYKDQKS